MFAAFDDRNVPVLAAGHPEPVNVVFRDPAYPGFFCGNCSCGEKLFGFSVANARRFIMEHEHLEETGEVSTRQSDQPSLF